MLASQPIKSFFAIDPHQSFCTKAQQTFKALHSQYKFMLQREWFYRPMMNNRVQESSSIRRKAKRLLDSGTFMKLIDWFRVFGKGFEPYPHCSLFFLPGQRTNQMKGVGGEGLIWSPVSISRRRIRGESGCAARRRSLATCPQCQGQSFDASNFNDSQERMNEWKPWGEIIAMSIRPPGSCQDNRSEVDNASDADRYAASFYLNTPYFYLSFSLSLQLRESTAPWMMTRRLQIYDRKW